MGDGSVRRIEPADGPTDRAAYDAHHRGERTLVQDDHVFDAVCVGMGCMGVICTAMVEVGERFHMREVRTLHPWAKVKADLEDGAVLARHEHYELAFSPYDDDYAYPFLVTTRDPVSDPRHRPWDTRTRNLLVEAAALFPFTPHVINLLLDIRPSLAPKLLLALGEVARQEALRQRQLQGLQHRQREHPAGVLVRDRRADGRPSHRGRRDDLPRRGASGARWDASTRARRSRCAS